MATKGIAVLGVAVLLVSVAWADDEGLPLPKSTPAALRNTTWTSVHIAGRKKGGPPAVYHIESNGAVSLSIDPGLKTLKATATQAELNVLNAAVVRAIAKKFSPVTQGPDGDEPGDLTIATTSGNIDRHAQSKDAVLKDPVFGPVFDAMKPIIERILKEGAMAVAAPVLAKGLSQAMGEAFRPAAGSSFGVGGGASGAAGGDGGGAPAGARRTATGQALPPKCHWVEFYVGSEKIDDARLKAAETALKKGAGVHRVLTAMKGLRLAVYYDQEKVTPPALQERLTGTPGFDRLWISETGVRLSGEWGVVGASANVVSGRGKETIYVGCPTEPPGEPGDALATWQWGLTAETRPIGELRFAPQKRDGGNVTSVEVDGSNLTPGGDYKLEVRFTFTDKSNGGSKPVALTLEVPIVVEK